MSDIHEIEVTAEELRKIVKKKDMALKLAGNREFKALILDGYLIDEAARLVGVSADPTMEKVWPHIQNDIRGISCFKQFMMNTVRMGEIAENDLRDNEEELEYLRSEEAS